MDDNIKSLSLNFNAKIQPIEKLNEQFTLCKCYVMALGKNRNFSYFSKENIERNIESLNYIPVVGHLIENEDGTFHMGSHDIEFLIENNELKIKTLTVPYGVVVENSYAYEDVIEQNGNTVTYLTANIILWTYRYPELMDAIYNENIYFGESMEINYSKWKQLDEDKNYTDIVDFVFSALCLLGKSDNPEYHTEPCFPSSKIEPYSNNFNQSQFPKIMGEMKEQYSLMMKELKEITFNNQSSNEVDIKEIGKEDVILEDTTNIIVEETIDNNNEEIVVEEINTPANEEIVPETENEENVETTDTEEVVEVEEVIETETNTEENVEVQPEFIEKSEYERLQSEFEQYKKDYSTPNSEVADLKVFKENTIKEQYELNVSSLFEKFDEKLSDMESYKTLKSNYSQLSVDEIEEKLFALLGKKSANFSTKQPKENVVKVMFDNEIQTESNDQYGGLLAKHYNN